MDVTYGSTSDGQALAGAIAGIWPAATGIVVVGVLIAAVYYGIQRRAREPAPPAGPQPRAGAWHTRDELDSGSPPDHGPGHQDEGPRAGAESGSREPAEVPRDGRRRTPGEFRDYGSRPAASPDRNPDDSGPAE
jgi:hypothetical protein